MSFTLTLAICLLGTMPASSPCLHYRGAESFHSRIACEVRGTIHMRRIDQMLRRHRLEAYYRCKQTLWST